MALKLQTAAAIPLAAIVTVWAVGQLAAAWRDRPRPVRDAHGRWHAAARPHNGWGPRR